MLEFKSLRRIPAALAVLSVASLATAGAVGAQKLSVMPASAASGAASWSCTVPNNVRCTVTSQKGIQSVKVMRTAPPASSTCSTSPTRTAPSGSA